MWESVPRWLPADIRANCMGLWEWKLAPDDFGKLIKLLAANPPDRLEPSQAETHRRQP